jgi:protein-disulfide isomerase
MTSNKLLRAALAAAAAFGAMVPAASAQTRGDDRVGAGFTNSRPDGPNRRDWLRSTRHTREGGFLIGNPEATTKIVEYVSPSCPECAQFTHEAGEQLFQQYVRTGHVSVEYRLYYRNGVDIAAGMLLNCLPPDNYFDMMHNLLGSQPQWLGRIAQVTPAQRQALSGLPALEVARRMIPMLGLDAIARRNGLDTAAQQACLTQERLDGIERVHQAAVQAGVQGTPSFAVNGTLSSAHNWAALAPLVRGR